MIEYVGKSAKLSCTGCPGYISQLNVDNTYKVKTEDNIIGVENDVKPEKFLPLCVAIPTAPKSCNPKIQKWLRTKSNFKIGGKSALLFPNMAPCLAGPGLVIMTKSNSRKTKVGASGKSLKDSNCKWKGCSTKHKIAVGYTEDGCLRRDGKRGQPSKSAPGERTCYRGAWPHPNACNYSQSLDQANFPNQRVKSIPNYPIQNHHVMPCESFDGLDNLIHNLVLIGWDLNEGFGNGLALPKNEKDMIWHNLPYHNGSHPTWNTFVKGKLAKIQSKMLRRNLCSAKGQYSQDNLIVMIMNLGIDLRNKLINWEEELKPGMKGLRNIEFQRTQNQTLPRRASRIYLNLEKIPE